MANKLFKTKYFSLIIGALIVAVALLAQSSLEIAERLETQFLGVHFSLTTLSIGRSDEEGVTRIEQNPKVSGDIQIIGVDTRSLSDFGRWPWPRWRHADLINSFARISDPTNRERALFLDFFFIEPSDEAYDDAVLLDAVRDSGRVYLETVLANESPPPSIEDEFFQRHEVLFDTHGRLTEIAGRWWEMDLHFGLEPPLQPLGRAAGGYGHANFTPDHDDLFRRQPLVARLSRLVEEIRFEQLSPDTEVDTEGYERLAWIDREGRYHHIEAPLTESRLASLRRELERRAPQAVVRNDNEEITDQYYVIRRFQDQFIPSITLSLALDYFNKDYSDLEVVIGEQITIPDVEVYDPESDSWVPYEVPVSFDVFDEDGNIVEEGETRIVEDIVIPINADGEMLINFMGPPSSPARDGYRTFPVRPYSVYTSRGVAGPDPSTWGPSRGAANDILMVGPFAAGMADDVKPTPVGLMYGVEIHANALNTIIMDQFIQPPPAWVNISILVVLVMLTAFIVGRIRNPLYSLIIVLIVIGGLFFGSNLSFELNNLWVNFTTPAIAILLAFLTVVLYRILTEGRERRALTETFGKFVAPEVVKSLLDKPPTLGGVDQEVTVLFSDIRRFTEMSEGMGSQDLVKYLNEYLTAMTDTILEYNGTLDKYVGDEIMCFWGAPLPQKHHRILAAKCALRQMEVLHEFNARMAELRENDPAWAFVPPRDIDIGIGINSGIVTVGNMGSPGRLNYTLMGDHVNLAARLEGTNKVYGTNVIISENTWAELSDQVIARELDDIRVKGKQKPVSIYELIDVTGGLKPTAEELAYEENPRS
jgi:adenylate cyclase